VPSTCRKEQTKPHIGFAAMLFELPDEGRVISLNPTLICASNAEIKVWLQKMCTKGMEKEKKSCHQLDQPATSVRCSTG